MLSEIDEKFTKFIYTTNQINIQIISTIVDASNSIKVPSRGIEKQNTNIGTLFNG